ncbi:MAG: hypothetical protein BWX70_01561 [Verrucomicrobia bacterium ADurb.Bin070]|nr:MAG: hypothetical protein BWX70_01561 [Verrucomicrobia bacterium ADurb.Bin070]
MLLPHVRAEAVGFHLGTRQRVTGVMQQPVSHHRAAREGPVAHRGAAAQHGVGEVVVAAVAVLRVRIVAVAQTARKEDHLAVGDHVVPRRAVGIAKYGAPACGPPVVGLHAVDGTDQRVVAGLAEHRRVVTEQAAAGIEGGAPARDGLGASVEDAAAVVKIEGRDGGEDVDEQRVGIESLAHLLHVGGQPRHKCVGHPAVALRV